MKPEIIRLSRLFACVSRIQDLQMIIQMKQHYINYGKLGETNLKLLADLENRVILELTKWDNYFADREKEAVDKYISVVTANTDKQTTIVVKEDKDNANTSKQEKKTK